jgi:hypothetical protein
MSRINAFLVLVVAFSAICFGATLMQISINRVGKEETSAFQSQNREPSRSQLIKDYQIGALAKIASELYRKAFSLSFSGDWQKAQAASECAAQLVNMNGSHKWGIEPKDLIN